MSDLEKLREGVRQSLPELAEIRDPALQERVVVAGALAHDLGKPYEFSPRNRARWEADPAATGKPAIRHPTPSLEALIVRYADSIQWRILDKVDLLAGKRYPDV